MTTTKVHHVQQQITFMKAVMRLFTEQEKSPEGKRLAALLTEEIDRCQHLLNLSEGSPEALENADDYVQAISAALALAGNSEHFENQLKIMGALLDFVKVFRKSE